MQSRRSGEPRSALSRASFDDRERLIFPGDDEEANAGFGLTDLTEDSEEDDAMEPMRLNGHANGHANGILRNAGVQEYSEVPQKMNMNSKALR